MVAVGRGARGDARDEVGLREKPSGETSLAGRRRRNSASSRILREMISWCGFIRGNGKGTQR